MADHGGEALGGSAGARKIRAGLGDRASTAGGGGGKSAASGSSSSVAHEKEKRGALPKLRGRQLKRHQRRATSLSPSRGGAPLVQSLKVFPENEVSFPLEEGYDAVGTILIENTSLKSMYAFRVKTNAPDRYLVRPAMGLVPPKSSVTLMFILRKLDVAALLEQMRNNNQNKKEHVPLATDKFLLLTAEVDEVNDFSTADEVKDLSTLWSMSRWKKKTQRKKLIAQHHRKIVVSSDSDSDEEEGLDEAQKVVTGAPTSSAQTVLQRSLSDPIADTQVAGMPSQPSLLSRQSDLLLRSNSGEDGDIDEDGTNPSVLSPPLLKRKIPGIAAAGSPMEGVKASPRLQLEPLKTSTPLVDSPSASPSKFGIDVPPKLPSPGGRTAEFRSLDPLFERVRDAQGGGAARPLTAPLNSSRRKEAKRGSGAGKVSTHPKKLKKKADMTSLKKWAKSNESAIAEFDSLPLSEKIKKYKELKARTSSLRVTKKAWGLKSEGAFSLLGKKAEEGNTKQQGNSTRIEQNDPQAREAPQQAPSFSPGPFISRKGAGTLHGTRAQGLLLEERINGAKVATPTLPTTGGVPSAVVRRDIEEARVSREMESKRVNKTSDSLAQNAGGAPVHSVRNRLTLKTVPVRAYKRPVPEELVYFVPEFPYSPKSSNIGDAYAALGYSDGAEEGVDGPEYSVLDPYHDRLWYLWWYLYDLRYSDVYNLNCYGGLAEDGGGGRPSELVSHNMYSQRYGAVHSPGTIENLALATSNRNSAFPGGTTPVNTIMNTTGYDEIGGNPKSPGEITNMDFIKSVVFLEKNLQQVQFAMLKLKDTTVDMEVVPVKCADETKRPLAANDRDNATCALLLLWYRLAKHRLEGKRMGESVPEFEVSASDLAVAGTPHCGPPSAWVAPTALTFAAIRRAEHTLSPYWDLVERVSSLQQLITFAKEQNRLEEGDMRIRLAKAMNPPDAAPLVASPWGEASAAAKKIVQLQREKELAKLNAAGKQGEENSVKTRSKLALRALERTKKCGEKLRKLEEKFNDALLTIQETVHYPLWYLEWLYGVLQCDTEIFNQDASQETYWWSFGPVDPAGAALRLPRGWYAAETSDGQFYYCHDDGRVQWDIPKRYNPDGAVLESADEEEEALPDGWKEALTDDGLHTYYYHETHNLVQWEVPADHGAVNAPPSTPRMNINDMKTPRTPRTPRAKGSHFYEIESPHGVKKMKFTFQELDDDSVHGSTPTTPGRASRNGRDAHNTNNSTASYWNTGGDLWWDDGSYTGYRAGYAFQTYSWYSYRKREMQKQNFKAFMENMNNFRPPESLGWVSVAPEKEASPAALNESPEAKSYAVDVGDAENDSPLNALGNSLKQLSATEENVADRDFEGNARLEDGAFAHSENAFQEEEAPRSILFYVRALADYEAADDSEMDLYDGELLEVFHQDVSGWWEGRRERDGKVGWFPSNYVYVKNEIWTIYEDDHELEDGEEEDAFFK